MAKEFFYRCINCGTEYSSKDVHYLCKNCEITNSPDLPPRGVLKTIYPFEKIKKHHNKNLLLQLQHHAFLDLLPIEKETSLPFLKVGQTPVYALPQMHQTEIPFHLWVKDDSQNPTFSFKDRASAIVSAFAKENNLPVIVAASTGNAGSSIAGICAAQQQKAVILVPAKAPKAKLTQILMYGATIVPVDGTYDMAFDLSIEISKKFGWYNRNTAYNPLTIEGKKTVAFEIVSQFYPDLPDKIFVPVGDGVILSGVYKGFEDLMQCGIIEKMPTIVAVQAQGSDNIAQNMKNIVFVSKPGNTIADSISVDIPRNYYMATEFLEQYYGETAVVSDEEIMLASGMLSKNSGIFTEPAAAAAFAGMLQQWKEEKINAGAKVLVLLTGCGLKDLNAVQSQIKMPEPVAPQLNAIVEFLKK